MTLSDRRKLTNIYQHLHARDPFPYDGPLARADGVAPYNQYFWPMEQWVFSDENGGHHVDFRMRIEIVALADGRWATSGFVWDIEAGSDGWGTCVFATRNEAVRTSAARMIRLCRIAAREVARDQKSGWTSMYGIHRAPQIITWARCVAARETGRPEPAPITVPVPVATRQRVLTGLPLFDTETSP